MKDNTTFLWFKRKRYGWGWTPATKEGWLVLLVYAGLVGLISSRLGSVQSEQDVLWGVVGPMFIISILLVLICYKTGEAPRWQGGGKEDGEGKQ